MSRRHLDQYFTPRFATRVLLHLYPDIALHNVYECCSGQNDIATELTHRGARVTTNDIDPAMPADWHLDAASDAGWAPFAPRWVVSNPPFSIAPQIVQRAYQHATNGIAMLLRLSYLEPCQNRGQWLSDHPLTHLIVLPRISFTGDGKTDNVTVAWFVWSKGAAGTQAVTVVTKEQAALWSK